MTFNKSFNFSLYGNLYNAYVEGVVEQDEQDRNVTYTNLDTIIIETEDGELIDETHPDYDDLVDEIYNKDLNYAY